MGAGSGYDGVMKNTQRKFFKECLFIKRTKNIILERQLFYFCYPSCINCSKTIEALMKDKVLIRFLIWIKDRKLNTYEI